MNGDAVRNDTRGIPADNVVPFFRIFYPVYLYGWHVRATYSPGIFKFDLRASGCSYIQSERRFSLIQNEIHSRSTIWLTHKKKNKKQKKRTPMMSAEIIYWNFIMRTENRVVEIVQYGSFNVRNSIFNLMLSVNLKNNSFTLRDYNLFSFE